MSIVALEKRLEAAEVQLTPKEWAIRLADEMHRHPSEQEFFKAEAERTPEDSHVMRPFHALADQAEERHPGNRPADWQAKRELYRKLHDEYDTLKLLLAEVNQHTRTEGRVLGLAALLRLATVPEPPLSGEGVPITVELLKAWREQAVSALGNIFVHQAAVRIIQDRHFSGHAVLFQDVEELLTMAIQVVASAAEEFEACRGKTAATAAKRKRKGEAAPAGDVPALDIEAVRAGLDASKAAVLAERWYRAAKRECILAGLDGNARTAVSWQWLREELRGDCLNGVYHAEPGA